MTKPVASNKPPLLLTPGPLTTADATREAMLRDWGSRDTDFIALNARVRAGLLDIANGAPTHTTVPLQGSGTFIVEAALCTLVPHRDVSDRKLLICANGAYGHRMARICEIAGRSHAIIEAPEDTPIDPAAVRAALEAEPALTHVALVHCETTTGLLNPVAEIAAVVAGAGRELILDSMSAFGALPVDVQADGIGCVVASSNKCLEGPPGFGYAVVREDLLAAAKGNAHSLSLDLEHQWRAMEGNGQWRFTPPTHVIAAFDAALAAFQHEGGQPARLARYADNAETLIGAMRGAGFETYLPDDLQAPIIVTFHAPADPAWDFAALYDRLVARGFAIYPGKLTQAETFRIGVIGQVTAADMTTVAATISEELAAMGIKRFGWD